MSILLFGGILFSPFSRLKHSREPLFDRNLRVVATGQAGGGGELFVLR